MAFRSVPYDSLSLNPFTKIGKEWALLTAGDENGFNTMTVSWGAMGFMWGKPSVTVYIRPQRYTKKFVDANDTFTLSFYGNAYFEEAELVLVCRKMSRTPLRPEQFLDETVDGRWYPDKDYHEMYIAEVIDVLVKES